MELSFKEILKKKHMNLVKEKYQLMEAYNMTLEAAATKLMWVLGQTKEPTRVRELFYRPVENDLIR